MYFFEWIIQCGLLVIFVDNPYSNIENLYVSLYNMLNILLVKKEEKLQKSTLLKINTKGGDRVWTRD